MLLSIVLFVFIVFIIVKLYFKLIIGWCKSNTCLVGKTVLVTGTTSGIGYETALDIAKRGAKVILGCINEEEGNQAKEKIINETGNNNIIVKIVDFSSFDSVRYFAKEIISSEDRLDILVNNAGATGIGNKRTQDDCLYLMQVNYFSPFLLTNLLIGLLKKSKSGRIINVASMVAQYVNNFNLVDINEFVGNYNTIYCRSKLCIILFTIELAKRLRDTNITTYSVHPGAVQTNLFINLHDTFIKIIIFVSKPFFKTPEEGAQTTIHCVTRKNIEEYNGEHFENCQRVPRYKTAKNNLYLCERLWEKTEDIVALKPEEKNIQ